MRKEKILPVSETTDLEGPYIYTLIKQRRVAINSSIITFELIELQKSISTQNDENFIRNSKIYLKKQKSKDPKDSKDSKNQKSLKILKPLKILKTLKTLKILMIQKALNILNKT